MSEVLAVGSKAPAFTATASDGKSYSLAEVLKKSSVALIFYPGDNTPGCNRQLSAVRDDFAKFERSGLQPFGVNPAGLESHQKYAQEFGFHVPPPFRSRSPAGAGRITPSRTTGAASNGRST